MTEPILWDREPHSAAKHRVLRSYLDGWIPVMANQTLQLERNASERRLLLVDGFAGPGRYATREPGSPLIMIDSLTSRSDLGRWADLTFEFLEAGEYEATFGRLVDETTAGGKIPTFAFIDPFGYSSASMSLTGRLLDFPRCEVLIFLPLSFIRRFVGGPGQEKALTSLFGCKDWHQAIGLSGDERSAFLLDLFAHQLGTNTHVAHVRSFQLHTEDGNDYRLVFGLGHDKGLELAKDAMWKVDPIAGTSYVAVTESGQEVLFSPEDLLDTAPLLAELRAKFGDAWFSIAEAERCTLIDTPFRKAHLRTKTLQPAEREGTLEVQRPGHSGYPAGTRLRFLK